MNYCFAAIKTNFSDTKSRCAGPNLDWSDQEIISREPGAWSQTESGQRYTGHGGAVAVRSASRLRAEFDAKTEKSGRIRSSRRAENAAGGVDWVGRFLGDVNDSDLVGAPTGRR